MTKTELRDEEEVFRQKMLEENRLNVEQTTKNFAGVTKNLNNTMLKFDNSIKQNALNKTMQNVDESFENLDKFQRI